MNKIRFGLIGCGDIAHIRYFYSIPHFEEIELVGIYDMNKPFLQKTAEELGVKAFNSYEEMRTILPSTRSSLLLIIPAIPRWPSRP